MKAYMRAKDYCTSARQTVDISLNIIRISIDLGQTRNIPGNVAKAESADAGDVVVSSKLKVATALSMLSESQYKAAALKFLDIEGELGGNFSAVIAAEDVAMYGTMCALASLSRHELEHSFLENSKFKNFLELIPTMRTLVLDFFHGQVHCP